MKAILSLLTIPAVAYVVLLKTVIGIPAGVFHSMFTVINMERYELTPDTNGKLLSYIGILTMVGPEGGHSIGWLDTIIITNISYSSADYARFWCWFCHQESVRQQLSYTLHNLDVSLLPGTGI